MEQHQTGCEGAGANFSHMEGVDSCIKIDGRIRVDSIYSTGGSSFTPTVLARPHR